MTFTELAQAIDQAEQEVADALAVVDTKADELKVIVMRHTEELAAGQVEVANATAIYNDKLKVADKLYAELHAKIPTQKPAVKAPTTDADLKQLWLDGQKMRGR